MGERTARLLPVLGCMVLLGWTAAPAMAAPIQYEVSFTASGFTPDTSGVSSVSGRFFIALDPDIQVTDRTFAIALDYVTQPLDSQLAYSYYPVSDPLFPDLLQVGGITTGTNGLASWDHDFELDIRGLAGGTPTFSLFEFANDSLDFYSTRTGTVDVKRLTPPIATTPIPPALPLFASALGGLGFFGWRRRAAAPSGAPQEAAAMSGCARVVG
jgi:hypothetical protein